MIFVWRAFKIFCFLTAAALPLAGYSQEALIAVENVPTFETVKVSPGVISFGFTPNEEFMVMIAVTYESGRRDTLAASRLFRLSGNTVVRIPLFNANKEPLKSIVMTFDLYNEIYLSQPVPGAGPAFAATVWVQIGNQNIPPEQIIGFDLESYGLNNVHPFVSCTDNAEDGNAVRLTENNFTVVRFKKIVLKCKS